MNAKKQQSSYQYLGKIGVSKMILGIKSRNFWCGALFISLLLSSSSSFGAFLNSGSVIEPQKALLYYPNYFQRSTDDSFNVTQIVIEEKWGTDVDGYFLRVPPDSSFPGDDPETKMDEFKSIISSGLYGLYVIATHGSINSILIEPYCRGNPSDETEAVSEFLANMAWYNYMGEDLSDPEVQVADYDGDSTPLCGSNGIIEYYIDQTGTPRWPPIGLPMADDDYDDILLAMNDDDEDGLVDEDPVNGSDDDGDGLTDEDPAGDANGDNAPGVRGHPYWGTGDGEDGDFNPNEILLGYNTVDVGSAPNKKFYSLAATSDFIQNYGVSTPNALAVIGACSAYWMFDAWMNPPMSIANYIGHTVDVFNYEAGIVRKMFFRAMGNSFVSGERWNYNIEEAFQYATTSPGSCAAHKPKDSCAPRMVLYQGDIYVDQSPPSTPHGPLGSIANPYTTIQSGLSNASSGDTVFVAEGAYYIPSTLNVPEGVTLKGAGPHNTELQGVWDINTPMFSFDSSFSATTRIQDFMFTGCHTVIAINVGSGTTIECPLEIRNNLFDYNAFGIRLNLASPTAYSFTEPYGLDYGAPSIYNNIFYDITQDAINCVYTRSHINHNTIAGSGNMGIYIGFGDGYDFPFVENNIVVGGFYGLFCYDIGPYAYPEVSRNIFNGNVYDVHCPGCYDCAYLNDIGVNPVHVTGPFSADLGGAGNYYLGSGSPALNRASDAVESDNFGRLTTNANQTPGPENSQADRGYYYHIRCEDVPTYTPQTPPPPTNTPTETPTGPTSTPTAYQSPTPIPTDTPIPSPTGTTLPMGYYDDFESGSDNWTATGLWHVPSSGSTYAKTHSGEFSFRYARTNQDDYNTGASPNTGDLILNPVYIDSSSPALTFYSWEETEGSSTGVDTRKVWASADNGATWDLIYQSSDNSGEWHYVTVPLTYSDQYVIFKFSFDTVDSEFNDYLGWYIDDVFVGVGPLPSTSFWGKLILLVLMSAGLIICGRKYRYHQSKNN